ncbi:hypothetical protein AMECASPLE_003735 [Ameca splendens]|uniref:Uncharacterized protein n=1 Tax=Ameca splendens TaxID=208324 RepID=A0ABV0XMM0_9TELE
MLLQEEPTTTTLALLIRCQNNSAPCWENNDAAHSEDCCKVHIFKQQQERVSHKLLKQGNTERSKQRESVEGLKGCLC